MNEDYDGWPWWPLLPLKNETQCGTLVETSTGFAFFEDITISNPIDFNNPTVSAGIELLEKLLQDGWYVDCDPLIG